MWDVGVSVIHVLKVGEHDMLQTACSNFTVFTT